MSTLAHRALGFGLGLRPQHYEAVLQDRISIDWLEVLTDNYLVPGGRPLHYLARIRERFPLAMSDGYHDSANAGDTPDAEPRRRRWR